jgi:hypothetical protein
MYTSRFDTYSAARPGAGGEHPVTARGGHDHGWQQKASPRTITVEQGEKERDEVRQPDGQDDTGDDPQHDPGVHLGI